MSDVAGTATIDPVAATDWVARAAMIEMPSGIFVGGEIRGPAGTRGIHTPRDTPYGLAAAVWTGDLGAAHRISRRLRAGTVWVNCYEEGDLSVPFGGVRLSGFGRDKSRHALDEYSDLKTTWINYGS